MRENNDDEKLRSQEINEVLTKIPRKIIRWGNAIILLCILGIFIFSANIPYPEKLECEIEFKSTVEPLSIQSKTSGFLEGVFSKNKDRVLKGDTIITISSNASSKDIKYIKSIINSIDINSTENLSLILKAPNVELGSLSLSYLEFENAYFELCRLLKSTENFSKTINNSFNQNLDLSLQKRKVLRSIESLNSLILEWEASHNYIAKTNGILYLPNIIEPGTEIQNDELMYNIYPKINYTFTSEVMLNSTQRDKISIGQTVLIDLSKSEDFEPFIIKGHVGHINNVVDNSEYFTASIVLIREIDPKFMNDIFKAKKIKRKAIILLNKESLLNTLLTRKVNRNTQSK